MVIKWMSITFGAGMALIVLEYFMAKRKKEGFTPTDKNRLVGMFWLSFFAALLVGSLVWYAGTIE